jgi:hypothetical protein
MLPTVETGNYAVFLIGAIAATLLFVTELLL